MAAHDTPPEKPREPAIGDLVKRLGAQTSTLVRQEIDLAKAELTEKGRVAGQGAGLFGGAALVGLMAAGALTAALILALDTAMDAWLAALIVTVVMGALAALLALQGRNRMRAAAPPVPQQTIETVKEDVEWAKTRTPSAQR